ncbi:hypothetical protein [uncultured Algibacter sp.]|uniref:hypothetical protein n=1 Tax=uncultured Algibacter sp. TaxID=298659 RepID=UPI0026218BD1|nr:hypothetical protein [uncultured Algibacter sp.]
MKTLILEVSLLNSFSITMSFKYCLVFVLLLNLFLGRAQEGNYKFNNFGNRSILLVGNVTGSVSDLGLTYYNPSFLANTDNVGFSLNAKAYQLVNLKLKSSTIDDAQISSTKFNSASTMAGGVFNLFNTRFAYSYLTKSNNNTNISYSKSYLNDDILNQFPNAKNHHANINLNTDLKDDWTGGSWAYKVNENFNLGVSAFVSLYKYGGSSLVNHIVESGDDDIAFYQNTVSFNQKSYGLFMKLGANYKFPKFVVGLNINLPYLEVVKDGSFSYSKIVSGVGPGSNQYLDYNFDDLTAKRKVPLGISVGTGIPINRGKFHLNIDYITSMTKYTRLTIPDIDTGSGEQEPVNFDEERKAVLNIGIGVEYRLRDNLKAYGGFSTDFNSLKNSANIFDISTSENKSINTGEDFYHLSAGIDWKLKWLSIISGITNTNSSTSFVSPYTINFGDSNITNEPNTQLKYTRWQFVIGIDVPILNKKLKSFSSED